MVYMPVYMGNNIYDFPINQNKIRCLIITFISFVSELRSSAFEMLPEVLVLQIRPDCLPELPLPLSFPEHVLEPAFVHVRLDSPS